MTFLLALVTAMVISLVVVPVMVRIAPKVGMMDQPNGRKVHVIPIPRVGGIGIVAGALITVLVWAPKDELVLAYVLASFMLLIFGVWDDKQTLRPSLKFIGQFAAVLIAILFGGLHITMVPFVEQPISAYLGIPFTAFAMVGVTNAVNTSDGLDGLAGGLSILSFAAILLLAYLVGSDSGTLILIIAAIGGTFGFLRYNTHPAKVFMGDGGSQFLGFSISFTAVLLTQRIDPELSPMVVLFILGLPVVDLIAVMVHRAHNHMSLFKAAKDHMHHRLLNLGFVHKESVVIIYSLHSVFVLYGIYLRYADEWLITGIYATLCAVVYTTLYVGEKRNWKAHRNSSVIDKIKKQIRFTRLQRSLLIIAPRRFLEVAVPFYLIMVSLWVNDVSEDFGLIAAILVFLIVVILFFMGHTNSTVRRMVMYITAAFVVYLAFEDRMATGWEHRWVSTIETAFFSLVVLALALAIRFGPRRRTEEFTTTAMDYLLFFIILIGVIASQVGVFKVNIDIFVVELVIVLYACEFLFIERREHMNWLGPSLLITLLIIALRGLGLVQVKLNLIH